MSEPMDLGHGHVLRAFTASWSQGQTAGYTDVHPDRRDSTRQCGGAVDILASPLDPEMPVWTVEQRDPLTLSPSLLCLTCGDHGFIREGKWVPA